MASNSMSNNECEKIDFVVLWVDPSDEEWQKARAKYSGEIKSDYADNSIKRYRDWDLFKYWFRGVEKFAPWVNKVHLVTCGHVPKWLNLNHPKLHVVKHSEFMPKDALPTFNSNAIELCVHKIPGLAEQFVLFNDDMFIIKKVKPTDFFKNGKPVNSMSLLAITPSGGRLYSRTLVNNMEIINNHFNFHDSVKANLTKYISLKQGKYILTTIPLFVYADCPGFKNHHIGVSYLKSTFQKIWEVESDTMTRTVHSRFRDYDTNVNHWLMNYWQFMEGNYVQNNAKFGVNISAIDSKASSIIRKQKRRVICLGDSDLSSDDFKVIQKKIDDSFKSILTERSSCEI